MIRTGVIGIGGFGRTHVRALRRMEEEGLAQLVAAAQPPMPEVEADIAALREQGVRVWPHWRDMLAGEELEAVTIAAPVPLHAEMTSGALAAGAHVLLEKPPVPSVAALEALAAQAESAGRLCAVDFQMLSAGSTRALKALVASGELGPVQRVTAVGLWKRLDSYYQRSPWHGRLREPNGEWTLGGPVANAMGHLLNQCLYFATPNEGFDMPVYAEAELYRAHPGIENEDTAAVRLRTAGGVVVGFYPTFCVAQQQAPWIELTAMRATVRWEYDRALHLRWSDGREEERVFGPDERIDHVKMFRNFFRAVRGEEALLCPLGAARAFTAAAVSAYEAGVPVRPVNSAYVERVPDGDSIATLIRGVADDIQRAAATAALFTQVGAPWA
ncbi:MAG: Gfo/Idh/MocA family oxidoreductase [Armatimonadota bacterium]|nr:Gfo/Idh/MocA family oxidoreductase [Armatimonadota bacterium]